MLHTGVQFASAVHLGPRFRMLVLLVGDVTVLSGPQAWRCGAKRRKAGVGRTERVHVLGALLMSELRCCWHEVQY